MKAVAISALLLFGISLARAESAKIKGQIFVVSESGEAVKLALVEVRLHKENELVSHLEKKREASIDLKRKAERILDHTRRTVESLALEEDSYRDLSRSDSGYYKLYDMTRDMKRNVEKRRDAIAALPSYFDSGMFLMGSLPVGAASTKTDIDGKFSIDAPKGELALTAFSVRRARFSADATFWAVKVKGGSTVVLNNDNSTSSKTGESILQTKESSETAGSFFETKPSEVVAIIDKLTKEVDEAENQEKEEIKQKEIQAKEAHERVKGAIAQVKDADESLDDGRQESSRRSLVETLKENDFPNGAELLALLESQIENGQYGPILIGKEKEAYDQAQKRRETLAPYFADKALAQRHAIELLPAIGEAGTPENKEFIERTARYRTENPDFFNEPDWPVRLAEEIKSNGE